MKNSSHFQEDFVQVLYAIRFLTNFTLKKKFLEGVEETVMGLLGQYAAFHEIKGRNLTCDR
jgi:hypothetical protein